MFVFRCYVDELGSDVIRAWYDDQDPAVQAAMDATIEILRISPREWWRRPQFKNLQNACAGLGAVRLKVDDDHHRILGFFGPNEDIEFTLLVPFKKDDDPEYLASCPEAFVRQGIVLAEPERSHECSFP